jgi:hypothetical protein
MRTTRKECGEEKIEFIYAHSLSCILKPSELWCDTEGMVFHPAPPGGGGGEVALLASPLVQELVEMGFLSTDDDGFFVLWKGKRHPVPIKEHKVD